MSINKFRGKYFFLSNFYSATVKYNGILYQNSEAAFQAQKCPDQAKEFSQLTPDQAKHLGRHVSIRPEWDTVKDSIMTAIIIDKFNRHPDLKTRLIETNGEELIEGNTWGDKYWGQVNGEGKNMLGKILMQTRARLKEQAQDNNLER